MKLLAVAAAGCGLVVCVACRHASTAPTATAGRAGFRFFEPELASPKTFVAAMPVGEPTPAITPARPIAKLAVPVYPAAALAGRAGFATVGVRLTIDKTGHVASVESSLKCFSTPGPWADDFRAAVNAAVAEWRFAPARLVMVEHIKDADGADDVIVRSSEATEWTCDVAFTFTETGAVLSGL